MEVIEKIRRKHGVVKAVKYGRFSSDMQREESLEAQDLAMEQFAKNHNITIVGEYYDRAKSGTSSDREEFQRLMEDSAKKKFHLVLVHKVDRFARNRQDSMNSRFHLKRNGVSVLAVSQLYDAESPEGMMMEAMLEAMAEYYSKNLATEVEKGKRMNAMKGLHVGGRPPLGYDVDRETMKLVINEHEAEAVKLIFDMAYEDRSYKQICDALRMRGFKTRAGRDFTFNSIHEILKNEKYTGTYVYSRQTGKDPYGKRNGHRYKDEEDMVKVENGCPAITTKEVYQHVQKRMTRRRAQERGGQAAAKTTYLLSGKVRCGLCGSVYDGINRRATPTHKGRCGYRCGRKNKSVQCINREIGRDVLEDYVLKQLAKLVFDDRLIPGIVDCYNAYQLERNKDTHETVRLVRLNRDKLAKEIENIVNVITTTGSVALADRLQTLEREKAGLDAELRKLELELAATAISEEEIAEAFKKARKFLTDKTLENTKELIRIFVDRVLVFEDRVEVSFNFGFKSDIFKPQDTKPEDSLQQTPEKEEKHEKTHHAMMHDGFSQRFEKPLCGGEGATQCQYNNYLLVNPITVWLRKETIRQMRRARHSAYLQLP